MKHPKLYINHSAFGKVEYFAERTDPPHYSNYLECGKTYNRNHFPKIVADLFPYDISMHSTDNFVDKGYPVSAPEGGGWGAPGRNAFTSGSGTWIAHNRGSSPIRCSLTTNNQLFTLDSWKVILSKNTTYRIQIEGFFPETNETLIIDDVSPVESDKLYTPYLGILQQLGGFNKIDMIIYYSGGDSTFNRIIYNTLLYSELKHSTEFFKVPEAPESHGFKAYVNIDYRGISDKLLKY